MDFAVIFIDFIYPTVVNDTLTQANSLRLHSNLKLLQAPPAGGYYALQTLMHA